MIQTLSVMQSHEAIQITWFAECHTLSLANQKMSAMIQYNLVHPLTFVASGKYLFFPWNSKTKLQWSPTEILQLSKEFLSKAEGVWVSELLWNLLEILP